MSNPTFKPSEGKREEFRKYLEKNGVMDALTKVLVNLYEEPDKPEDALEFIRDRLAIQAGLETFHQMKEKTDELTGKIAQLEQEIESLKTVPQPAPAEEEVVATTEVVAESGEPAQPAPSDENPPPPETPAPEAPQEAPPQEVAPEQ